MATTKTPILMEPPPPWLVDQTRRIAKEFYEALSEVKRQDDQARQ